MKTIIRTLLITFLTYSANILASDINLQAAYGGAFYTVFLIKLPIAFIVFIVLSYGLWKKPKDTALKNGRWVGACMSAASVTLMYKPADLYFLLPLNIISLYAIGFIIGYIWRKVKRVDVVNNDLSKPASLIKTFLPTFTLFGLCLLFWFSAYNHFIIKPNTSKPELYSNNSSETENIYDAFDCGINDKDCKKHLGTMQFNVDKLGSQVTAIVFHDDTKETNFIKLDNCVIIDEKNWQCGGKIETFNIGNGVVNEIKDKTYTIIKNKLVLKSGFYKTYNHGKLVETSWDENAHQPTFIKRE